MMRDAARSIVMGATVWLASGCTTLVLEDDGGGAGGGAAGATVTSAQSTGATSSPSTTVAGTGSSVSTSASVQATSSSTGVVSPECMAFSSIHIVSSQLVSADGSPTFARGSAGTLNVLWRNDGATDFNGYPGLRFTSTTTDPSSVDDNRFAIFPGMEYESSFAFRVRDDAPIGNATMLLEVFSLGPCPITESTQVAFVIDG